MVLNASGGKRFDKRLVLSWYIVRYKRITRESALQTRINLSYYLQERSQN